MAISTFWVIVAGCATVLAIGAGFLRARNFVEDRIQEALSKDEVIKKISLLVKPDMVFDESGAIIVDRGACQFVQENGIQVTKGKALGETIAPTHCCLIK